MPRNWVAVCDIVYSFALMDSYRLSIFVLFCHPTSYGQLALKVINCVGQVGALGVVEVDLVTLYRNSYGRARRVDLVVAGDVDGALGHLGAEGLAVYGFGLVQDFVRALLQVVHGVGQVGALRVVEVDLVLDGISFHLERYGSRRRIDLVVAGDVDGALGHLGAEGLAADGLGLGDLRGRALEVVVHRVGQVGALGVVEVDDVVLNIDLDFLLIASARSISIVLDGLVTGYRDRCLCNSITVGLVADGLGRGENCAGILLQVVHRVGEVLYKVIVESQLQGTIRSNYSLTISVGVSAVQDIPSIHFGGRSRRISGLPLQILRVD